MILALLNHHHPIRLGDGAEPVSNHEAARPFGATIGQWLPALPPVRVITLLVVQNRTRGLTRTARQCRPTVADPVEGCTPFAQEGGVTLGGKVRSNSVDTGNLGSDFNFRLRRLRATKGNVFSDRATGAGCYLGEINLTAQTGPSHVLRTSMLSTLTIHQSHRRSVESLMIVLLPAPVGPTRAII